MDNVTRLLMQGAAGAAGGGLYIDEVFSTYVKSFYGSTNIVNNIDLAGEGGLVWTKIRNNTDSHYLADTVNGVNKTLKSDSSNSLATNNYAISAFNDNGFTYADGYGGAKDYATWTFRKAPGFFTIAQWTGNASAPRSISHDLGSVPGLIMVKCTSSGSTDWMVWHRDFDAKEYMTLNSTAVKYANESKFGGQVSGSAKPTSTTFSLGTSNDVNGNGNTYIAYIFAGGASTAATARSVEFDGNGDYLSIPTTPDFAFGTGDFTIEFWQKLDNHNNSPHQLDFRVDGSNTGTTNSLVLYVWGNDDKMHFWVNGSNRISSLKTIPYGQWQHVALVRNSGVTSLYLNGVSQGTYSDSTNYGSSSSNSNPLVIGQRQGNYASNSWDGEISNLRIVKGTAVYTSLFRPPTDPLTNITNTNLLCCNNASVTGSTVAPSSVNTYSINVTASGSSAYTLSGNDRNGSVSGNNATVTANVGDTLNFAVNASGHPFYIRVSNGGYNVSTPAATNQGSQSGTVSWTPNTAGTYYYQCGNHSGMIGTITINAASGSITANGSPTASTDSPFDDPEGFKFGEKGNQNLVKCGSYTGVAAAETINLGFEPQWVMVKCTDNSTAHSNWHIYDSMRGVVTGGNDKALSANLGATESDTYNYYSSNNDLIEFTPTGFITDPQGLNFTVNGSQNKKYIYIAIRRPDPLVAKPAEVGTDVFAMDGTSNGSNVFPQFTSGFPVDFSLTRNPTAGGTWDSWHTGARLLQGNYQLLSSNAAWATGGNFQYDYNDGIFIGAWSGYMSWMWKRHAGFDVVTYTGDAVAGRQIPHSLNKIPEMVWIKCRSNSGTSWVVGHKGLDGGNAPWTHYLRINEPDQEEDNDGMFNDTAPTSTALTLGTSSWVNGSNRTQIAMLFASVEGISKVGYFDGSNSDLTITTGFQPRFLIVKAASNTGQWNTLDTVRGWGAGNDNYLKLNSDAAQISGYDIGAPTTTGFTLTGNMGGTNVAGVSYIYYAHA